PDRRSRAEGGSSEIGAARAGMSGTHRLVPPDRPLTFQFMERLNPIPLRPDPHLAQRSAVMSLHGAMAALALGQFRDERPETIARRAWPDDVRAAWHIRGSTSPTDTTSAAAITQT